MCQPSSSTTTQQHEPTADNDNDCLRDDQQHQNNDEEDEDKKEDEDDDDTAVQVQEVKIRGGAVLSNWVFPRSSNDPQTCCHDDIRWKTTTIESTTDNSRCNDESPSSPPPPTTTTTTSTTLGERIQSGKTLLTISNLITSQEVEYLVQASLQAAKDIQQQQQQPSTTTSSSSSSPVVNHDVDNEGVKGRLVIRMPVQSAARRNHHPVDQALPESLSSFLENVIMMRILQCIDQNLCSSLTTTLFGYGGDDDSAKDDHDTISLTQLMKKDRLEFSLREPAVNVYHAPHGHFGLHKDGRALTILIALSDPRRDYDGGGGTAFWWQEFPHPARHDPSYVFRPSQPGTVALFGGQVHHCGLHAKRGTRMVFVASFSRASDKSSSSSRPKEEGEGVE